jgi:hypothetical protein
VGTDAGMGLRQRESRTSATRIGGGVLRLTAPAPTVRRVKFRAHASPLKRRTVRPRAPELSNHKAADELVGANRAPACGPVCCDTADGFPVEVDGWDMAGAVDDISGMTQWDALYARSGYRVRLSDGKWHDVPNSALIDPKTNKLGYAVVWLLPHRSFYIQCFLPGSGG